MKHVFLAQHSILIFTSIIFYKSKTVAHVGTDCVLFISVDLKLSDINSYRDFKIVQLASLLIWATMLMLTNKLKILDWVPLQTWCQILKADMVCKSTNGLAPGYLSSIFSQRSDIITSYKWQDSENKHAVPLPCNIVTIASVTVAQSSGTFCCLMSDKECLSLIFEYC